MTDVKTLVTQVRGGFPTQDEVANYPLEALTLMEALTGALEAAQQEIAALTEEADRAIDQANNLAGDVAALEASVQAPAAVDREALARHFYMRNSGRPGEDFDYLMERYRKGRDGFPHTSFGEADALLASGVLQDAAEVEARGLESLASEVMRDLGVEKFDRFAFATRLRSRAQQVRESK